MKTPIESNEAKKKAPVFYKYAFFTLIIILVFVAGGLALNRYQAQAKQLKQAKEAEQRAKQNPLNNYKFDARQSAPAYPPTIKTPTPAPAPKPTPAPAPAPRYYYPPAPAAPIYRTVSCNTTPNGYGGFWTNCF